MAESIDFSVSSTKQTITVDTATVISPSSGDGFVGLDGPKGIQGPTGNGTGYVTDTQRTSDMNALNARLNALDAQKGSWTPLTLLSGWTNYTNGWQIARRITIDGIMYLEGLLNGLSKTNDLIAVLPAGPATNKLFLIHTGEPHGEGRIDVFTNGNIQRVNGNLGYVSLSGISFPVA